MSKKLLFILIFSLVALSSFKTFSQEEAESVQSPTEDDQSAAITDSEEEDFTDPGLKDLLADPVSLMETAPLKFTLEECIKLALDHNSKLQATGYGIDAAEAQFKEADAGGWPILNYEYSTAPAPKDIKHAVPSFFSGDWAWWNRVKFDVGIPVYTFGKISLAKEMAKSGIFAAETVAFQEKSTLISKVRQLYYGVLLAEEIGRLFKEAHNRLQEEINKREKTENGDVEYSPMDNLKMKVFLYDLERRLAETRQKESLALEGLRVQLGLAPGTIFTVYSDKLRPVEVNLKEFNEYVVTAMKQRPDVKLLETGLDVKKNQYLLEKRKLAPDVGVGAFFELGRTVGTLTGQTVVDDFNDPFNFTRAGIGVRLSGKFDLHGSSARIKKAQSEYYKLNLEQMIAKEAIKLDVKDAYLKAKTAEGNMLRAKQAEKAARQLLFLAQSNFGIGVGEQKDIVDALQLLLMTRGRYFESVFDFNTSLAQLDEKVGALPEVAQ